MYLSMFPTEIKPKISFKPTHSLEKLQPNLKCDCEIAKAAHLVDFEGDCENEQGNAVELKKYKCSSDLGKDEVEASCVSLPEFDCLESEETNKEAATNINQNKITTDKDTFRQGVEPTQPDRSPNFKNPDNVKANPNTKSPNQGGAAVITENRSSGSNGWPTYNKFLVTLAAVCVTLCL